MVAQRLSQEFRFATSDVSALLGRGGLLSWYFIDWGAVITRVAAILKTFAGIFAASVFWIGLAVFVACPDKFRAPALLASAFFGMDGQFAIFTHASVIAVLLIADILIAIIILNDEDMRDVILSRVGLGCATLCIGAFWFIDEYAVREFSSAFSAHEERFLFGALLLLVIPRALSYWKPQGRAVKVAHSIGRS